MQIIADIVGLPIRLGSDGDAALRGGALLAAVGVGAFKDVETAAIAFSRPGAVIEPNAGTHPAYDRLFDEYRATYNALGPLMRRRAGHNDPGTG